MTDDILLRTLTQFPKLLCTMLQITYFSVYQHSFLNCSAERHSVDCQADECHGASVFLTLDRIHKKRLTTERSFQVKGCITTAR